MRRADLGIPRDEGQRRADAGLAELVAELKRCKNPAPLTYA